MAEKVEKRIHERAELHGHIADIGDGNFIYGGIIEDISISGLKLNGLPTKFAIEGRIYRIVISGGVSNEHIKLKVRPRWKRTAASGLTMDVGFRIIDAPWEWTELVQSILPGQEPEEEDVWDQFSS